MDLRTRLDVLHFDGVTFTDHSASAQNFTRDPFTVTLETDDFIYIGYRKAFNALYAALTTANTLSATLSIQYHATSGWTNLELSDDTKALTRSSFLTWDRSALFEDVTTGQEGWEAVDVNGKSQFWIRVSTDTNLEAVTFQALNLLFSDDNNILAEEPSLIDDCFYPTGQASHILRHLAAKTNIMSKLKNLGYVKNDSTGSEENINEWDILDIYEMRQASMHYAISQIYFNLADDPDDQYWAKYREYDKKFEESFALGRLRVDTDDDGRVDGEEKRRIKSLRWVR